MRPRAIVVLTVEFILLALIAGSAVALGKNSHDFLLADRQASVAPLQVGVPIAFTRPGDETGMLLGGWSRTTSWAAIAEQETAVLALKLPSGQASMLNFDGWLLARKPAMRQIEVSLDGREIGVLTAANSLDKVRCSWSIALPPASHAFSLLRFTVAAPRFVVNPQTSYPNRLMLGLVSMTLTTTPTAAHCNGGGSLQVTASGPATPAG